MARCYLPNGLNDLEKGVVLTIDEDKIEESDEETFDDAAYERFTDEITDPSKTKRYSGDVLFSDLKSEMTPLTEDGKILKHVLKSGTGLEIPDKSVVLIHYDVYLEGNAKPFDSTRLRFKPFKFLLGSGVLVPGLELGIASMKKEEIARILVGPEYAFGEMGVPPRIPENAELLYEVEILNFYEGKGALEFEDMTPEDQKKAPFEKIAALYRCESEIATDLFRKKQYQPAIARYRGVMRRLEDVSVADENEDEKRNGYLLKLYLNLAQCFLKIQKPEKVITYSSLALRLDETNLKGLFRKGRALAILEDYEQAEKMFLRVKELYPYEKSINKELHALEQQRKKHKEWEKMFCQNIFKEKKPVVRVCDMPENAELADTMRQILMEFRASEEKEVMFSSGYSEEQLCVLKEIVHEMNLFFVTKIQCGVKINKVAKKK